MDLDVALTALLVLAAPWIMHVGAIGSDGWKPRPIGILSGRLGRLLVRRMRLILLLNGILWASAYLLWKLVPSYWFVLPLIFSVPIFVAQTVLAASSGAQSS